MKRVYAKAPDDLDPSHEYITPGKEYLVTKDRGQDFDILVDDGIGAFCLWEGCAHLDFQNWARIEREGPDEPQANTVR